MFLNQEIKKIQEAKNRLTVCGDLRRQLVHIEVHDIWRGVFNPAANIAMGLSVIQQILDFQRERKGNRR